MIAWMLNEWIGMNRWTMGVSNGCVNILIARTIDTDDQLTYSSSVVSPYATNCGTSAVGSQIKATIDILYNIQYRLHYMTYSTLNVINLPTTLTIVIL